MNLFKTPQDLLSSVNKYFDHVDNNPTEIQQVSAGKIVTRTIERPYLWQGLYLYLGVCDLREYKKREEFSHVITYVKQKINARKLEGALTGQYNATIVSQLLGLKNRHEVTQKTIDDMINFSINVANSNRK